MHDLLSLLERIYDYDGEYALTPYEVSLLDPTGKGRQKWKALMSSNALAPNPIRSGWRCPRKSWSELLADILRSQDVPDPVWQYEIEMLAKVGPQGGPIPFSVILESVAAYYQRRKVVIPDSVCAARDWLIRLVRERKALYGEAQLQEPVLELTASAGAPFFGKKGSAPDHMFLKIWQSKWRTLVDVIGTRYMRKKPRAIHNEPLTSVYVTSSALAAVRHWLSDYIPELFMTWRNPYHKLYSTLTKVIMRPDLVKYSFDYSRMDEHVSWELVRELALPIIEELLPPFEYAVLAHYMELGFREPIFMGSYVRCGEHALFSGQPWTNDVETIISVTIGIALAILHHLEIGREHFVYALGDDLGVASKSDSLILDFLSISNSLGLESNIEKQEKSFTSTRFLRRVYYPRAPRVSNPFSEDELVMLGAYPRPLTYNSIINPEYPVPDISENAVAVLQICDVLYGHPQWSNFVTRMWANLKKGSLDNIKWDTPLRISWWEKVTRDIWHYTKSPTYQLLLKQGVVKQ